jgi:hypothetical protein
MFCGCMPHRIVGNKALARIIPFFGAFNFTDAAKLTMDILREKEKIGFFGFKVGEDLDTSREMKWVTISFMIFHAFQYFVILLPSAKAF